MQLVPKMLADFGEGTLDDMMDTNIWQDQVCGRIVEMSGTEGAPLPNFPIAQLN